MRPAHLVLLELHDPADPDGWVTAHAVPYAPWRADLRYRRDRYEELAAIYLRVSGRLPGAVTVKGAW